MEIDLVYFKNTCYTNGDITSLSEFEKLMGLLGCQFDWRTSTFIRRLKSSNN